MTNSRSDRLFVAYAMTPGLAPQFMPGLSDGGFGADQVTANIQNSTASMRHIISQATGAYNPQDMYQLMSDQQQVSH